MKRPPPDNRLDWRDPSMPVLRDYRMSNGVVKEFVDPDYETRYRAYKMEQSGDDYQNDPTYEMRRKK